MTKLTKFITKLPYFIIYAFAIFISACSSNKLDVDVSDVEVNLELKRMEQDIFESKEKNAASQNQFLIENYGWLYEAFMMDMIGEGSPYDPMAPEYLKGFSTHEDMLQIYNETQKEFTDFSKYHSELEKSFKYYKYYFPDSTLPRIITFYSNFNANILPYENNLAIGLDMYLGTDHEIIKGLPIEFFPQYIKEKMTSEYLVADAMKAWLMNRFAPSIKDGDDFLSTIITLGKVMYLLDAMMPLEEDYIKFGCTKEQMEWCFHQEKNIWKTIINNKALYSKDKGLILQYVSEGPFTKGMPHESPSKLGVWLGWQMVKDYVAHKDVSVLELLQQKSPKVILKSYTQGERD